MQACAHRDSPGPKTASVRPGPGCRTRKQRLPCFLSLCAWSVCCDSKFSQSSPSPALRVEPSKGQTHPGHSLCCNRARTGQEGAGPAPCLHRPQEGGAEFLPAPEVTLQLMSILGPILATEQGSFQAMESLRAFFAPGRHHLPRRASALQW